MVVRRRGAAVSTALQVREHADDGRPLTRDERLGYVRVIAKESSYTLRRAEWEGLNAAIDQGDPWYEGEDNYGCVVRIRLDNVEAPVDWSPQALAASRADDEAVAEWKRQHKLLNGED